MLPNVNQTGGLARQIAQVIGTGLASFGLISGSNTQTVVGLIAMVLPMIWELVRHTKVGTIIAAADAVKQEGGAVVLPDRAEAASIPRDNVIAK